MSRFLSQRLTSLAAYTPGEQPRGGALIKLNTNESPFPPAPGVLEAVSRAQVERLNLYSDPTAQALEEAIASKFGIGRDQVIAGNGSDEILAFCVQAFCEAPTGACFPDITYGFYPVMAQLYGVDARILPLDCNLKVAPADYDNMGRTIFLANPNAPTGDCLSPAQVERMLQNNPNTLVIVDEAYVDFGGESVIPLLTRYDNLLIVQTFSKAYNLAGARIGFAVGKPSVIDDLRRVKFSFNPYSLNRLSILAGAAAMEDVAYFQMCTQTVAKTRDWTAEALRARGFSVLDSKANFLFAKPPKLGGRQYYERLRASDILVRHFAAPRIDAYVRISIGTQAQMQALLDATDRMLEDA